MELRPEALIGAGKLTEGVGVIERHLQTPGDIAIARSRCGSIRRPARRSCCAISTRRARTSRRRNKLDPNNAQVAFRRRAFYADDARTSTRGVADHRSSHAPRPIAERVSLCELVDDATIAATSAPRCRWRCCSTTRGCSSLRSASPVGPAGAARVMPRGAGRAPMRRCAVAHAGRRTFGASRRRKRGFEVQRRQPDDAEATAALAAMRAGRKPQDPRSKPEV